MTLAIKEISLEYLKGIAAPLAEIRNIDNELYDPRPYRSVLFQQVLNNLLLPEQLDFGHILPV